MSVVNIFIKIFIVLEALFLLSCASTSSHITSTTSTNLVSNDYLYVNTDDNEKGAQEIADYLEKIGYEVLKVYDGVIRFKRPESDEKFIVDVKLSEDLDRLIFFKFFSVKDKYIGTSKPLEIVHKLNNKLNIGTFYIDKDGDFVYQTQLTFNNYLYKNEIDGFLAWYTFSILGTVIKAPELLEILE